MTDFIDEQLRLTAERITDAVAHAREPLTRGGERCWLDECVEREAVANALATVERWPLARLSLTATETRILWVLIANEIDPTARVALRELSTEADVDVSHDVLRRVVYGHRPAAAAWHELSINGALRRSCLVDTLDDNETPSYRQTFRISNRVLGLVHGNLEIDRDLIGVVACPRDMPRFDELIVDEMTREQIDSAILQRELVIVTGLPDSGRRSMLVAALRAVGRDVIAVDAHMLSTESAIADRQLRTLARECRLFDRSPLFVDLDALGATDAVPDRLGLLEAAFGETLVLATTTRPTSRRWSRPPIVIELPVLSGRDRAQMWQRSLPTASDGDADLLATLYPLAPGLIDAVGVLAIAEARDQPIRPEHITLGLRRVVDDRLAGLAKRLTITQTWNDLVLPEDQTMAVVELLARIRARRRVYEDWGFARKLGKGLGVTALFCGPPGTGKTMCAGLIAKDLGTEIYQVDLGKIVSKWLGETEKNLGALFDAAEASHAVLLFDEADSLFGKRTAVASSNDRHANQETNFLLQRIESFTGICILTTNHDPAIDDAFQRRLSVRVRFPLPDEDERERLWRAMIPDSAPIADSLDLSALAKKYSMAGGNIRNALLRAAFLAADANESIGDLHLRQAAQLEYEGMGKLTG